MVDLPVEESRGGARSAVDHRAGHRQRLKERFIKGGADAVADYELLELLLFQTIPRRDTKPLAKALLAKFGSLAGVLTASPSRLAEVKGAGPAVAHLFALVRAAAEEVSFGALKERPIVSSREALFAYMRTAMAFERIEQFRILFLDKKNGVIADEVQQRGTVDHTPVYPREVVKRALELEATALILVHNHPSGDPSPSQADIEMTRRIVEIAEPLGITVHDHLIVGRDGHASLRALGLMG